jgi:hypothetical protein
MKYLYIFEDHKDTQKGGDFYFLRKEPKYVEFFKDLMERDNFMTKSQAYERYNDIRAHRNTIKQNNIDVFAIKTVEELDDMIANVKLIERFNKFIKLLPNHLRNEIKGNEDKKEIFGYMVNEFDYEEYKEIFLTKVAKYRNVEELFSAINNYIGSDNKDIREIIDEIEGTDGIRVFKVLPNQLTAIVFSEKASCMFGSQQWCISDESRNYWDDYISDELGVQYFVWNFNKHDTNPLSKIGVTIYDNGRFDAFNKADKKVTHLIRAIGKDTTDSLLNIDQLPKEDLKEYFINNLRSDNYSGIKDNKYYKLLNQVVDDKFKRNSFFAEPYKCIKIFQTTDFLSDKEIQKAVDKEPNLITLQSLNKRLPTEFMYDFVIANPTKMHYVDKSHYENITEKDYLKMVFNYTDYIDELSFSSNPFSLISKLKEVRPEKFDDPIFIKLLFDTNLEVSLRYFNDGLTKIPIRVFNNMYRDNKKEWDDVLDKFTYRENSTIPRTDEICLILRNYFRNEKAMTNYDTMDLFIFNARYEKREVGVNSINNKKIYEEILVPEKLITDHPFNLVKLISQMRGRVIMYDDLKTYGIWVNKDLFDVDNINNMLDEDWFLDLVDSRKIEL